MMEAFCYSYAGAVTVLASAQPDEAPGTAEILSHWCSLDDTTQRSLALLPRASTHREAASGERGQWRWRRRRALSHTYLSAFSYNHRLHNQLGVVVVTNGKLRGPRCVKISSRLHQCSSGRSLAAASQPGLWTGSSLRPLAHVAVASPSYPLSPTLPTSITLPPLRSTPSAISVSLF